MKTTYITCILLAAGIAPAAALTVRTLPGNLATELAAADEIGKELIITGGIDVRDFETIRSLEGLETLDLSAAYIAEYASPTPLFPGRTWFAANSLPPYALFESSVSSVVLPSSVNDIRDGAFAASGVKSLTLPQNVRSLGDYAFYGASQLKEVTLPRALTEIGAYAFAGCASLTDVNLHQTSVTRLPERAFAGTSSLTSLNAAAVQYVGREAFSGSGLRALALPMVQELAPYALEGMAHLEGISINPNALMAEGLLMNATELARVEGVPAIVPDLFAANCSSYSPAGAVEAATRIGAYAFAGSHATAFILGTDVVKISAGAFAGCHELTEIDATALVGYTPTVDQSAFDGIVTDRVRLIVDDTCENVWRAHPVWGKFDVVPASRTDIGEVDAEWAVKEGVSIAVADGCLTAKSTAGDLTLTIHTTDGSRVATEHTPYGALSIPLADLPSGVLIVTATGTPEAGTRTIKLLN